MTVEKIMTTEERRKRLYLESIEFCEEKISYYEENIFDERDRLIRELQRADSIEDIKNCIRNANNQIEESYRMLNFRKNEIIRCYEKILDCCE